MFSSDEAALELPWLDNYYLSIIKKM